MSHTSELARAIQSIKSPSLTFDKVAHAKSDYANWVIPRRLMAGPSPLIVSNEVERVTNLRSIIDDGIDTFVCLQSESSPEAYKMYIPLDMIAQKNLVFLHFPIDDHKTPTHQAFVSSITTLLQAITSGRNIYIHCHGGHGRTGLYIVALLACLYKELREKDLAMYFAQTTHNLRKKQTLHFYGILPARVAENECQQRLLDDFFALLRFVA
jgi:predicted protein tyrosine phosphatase